MNRNGDRRRRSGYPGSGTTADDASALGRQPPRDSFHRSLISGGYTLGEIRAKEARMGIRRTRSSATATTLVGLTLVAALATGCGSSGESASTTAEAASASTLAPIHGKYSPTIDPADFVATVDNPYWPLKPGTGYHYKGVRGTTPQRDDEIVTDRTKDIEGVASTVVRDTVSERTGPVERTFDYYAQDTAGNVWYMGELSLEKQHGKFVKASDSWLSGVDGGKPGIIMPADPQPGDRYRQEYYPPGEALDEAHVLSLDGKTTVPQGSYDEVLVTSEYSPLEPQTEQKYYVSGVGEVKEKVVKGHHEEFQLVSITH
jgi:hypothetical protein